MPRRKQDRPKRMKWDDSADAPKDDEVGDDTLPSSSQASDCDPSDTATDANPDDESGGTDSLAHKSPSPRTASRGSAMSEVRSDPRASPASTRTVSPIPILARSSPLSARASPLLPPGSSPLMLVQPANETVLKQNTVIVNHISPESVAAMGTLGASPPSANDQERPLDFSIKKGSDGNPSPVGGILNLSKGSDDPTPPPMLEERPLDLTLPRKRAGGASVNAESRKTPKMDGVLASPMSPWGTHFPFRFTPSSSPTSSVEVPIWNGKVKSERTASSMPSSAHQSTAKQSSSSPEPTATKALEKMTELTRISGQEAEVYQRMLGGRQSAWQSHWLNKGADQARDVLKCVWCKQSFKSLAEMTAHMKEARHCGVNVSNANVPAPPKASTSSSPSSSTSEDLNLLIKETMPLPRKLVRGQDVWLGKGAEQTKQILKCMWCGQSFKSLADMTTHMQQTQHYTNIISQEQIISWKSPEDKSSAQSHVNAVLTCKVCDQAFSSLKDLSNHMVKNSHYKEHILRSITESGGRRRQTREKRKKSLPVRKLLELERAQQELSKGTSKESETNGKIMCEKCGEKIETPLFVEHVRQCVGSHSKNLLKRALLSPTQMEEGAPRDDAKSHEESEGSRANSVDSNPRSAPSSVRSEVITPSRTSRTLRESPESESEAPSVLNAIERLIEKSFDTRARKSVVTSLSPSASILKRLGVEDSANYTKPLMESNMPISHHISTSRPSSKEGVASVSSRHSSHEVGLEPTLLSNRTRRSSNHDRGGECIDKDFRRAEVKSASPDISHSPISIKLEASPHSRHNSDARSRGSPASIPADAVLSPCKCSPVRDCKCSCKAEPAGDNCESPLDPGKDCESETVEKQSIECTKNKSSSSHCRDTPESGLKSPCCVSDVKCGSVDGKSGLGSDRGSECTEDPEERRTPADDVGRSSPESLISPSPCNSERSFTPKANDREAADKECPEDLSVKSRDSEKVTPASTPTPSPSPNFLSSNVLASSPSGDHPLRELQKLLDKTDAHMTKPTPSTPNSVASSSHQGSPGAILAFSWACNDAVMTDSIMKCAFCDTPFISKGAYRHHLSKMHFVKDGAIPETSNAKTQPSTTKTTTTNASTTNNNNNTKTPVKTNFDESPTSKFLKYTELAKQLSSKYV